MFEGRYLPSSNPTGAEFDPEEDEPTLEAAWPHLQVRGRAGASEARGWDVVVSQRGHAQLVPGWERGGLGQLVSQPCRPSHPRAVL